MFCVQGFFSNLTLQRGKSYIIKVCSVKRLRFIPDLEVV